MKAAGHLSLVRRDASADRNWLNRLFAVRARQLLEGFSPQENYHFPERTAYRLRTAGTSCEAPPLVLIGDPCTMRALCAGARTTGTLPAPGSRRNGCSHPRTVGFAGSTEPSSC